VAQRPAPDAPRRGGALSRRARVAAAAQLACLLEIDALKPGNVRRGSDLPGLTYGDLALAATAIGPVFHRFAGARVGRLIFEAVRATRRLVTTNANLGIVLLLAPLAKAALPPHGGSPRARLKRVLRHLSLDDARLAYRAIRMARPGGLGRVPEQDLSRPPTATLLDCMRLAARHDALAREYATGYALTFGLALPALRRAVRRRLPLPLAIGQTYLAILAHEPDALLVRRHGAAAAARVSLAARRILKAGGLGTVRGRTMARHLDRRLKARRPPQNPGTAADLTTAALYVWLLSGPAAGRRRLRRR